MKIILFFLSSLTISVTSFLLLSTNVYSQDATTLDESSCDNHGISE